jgi:Tfp pilus assembly protein PilN
VRPVNLTPPEDRRGERAPLRSGALSYFVVGGLALLVAAVCAVVLTGNQIKDREAEVTELEASELAARTEAERLRAFADFASVSQARTQTVTSLAQSRFDWERVLRELALVIPDDIWLVSLSGGATGGGSEGGGAALGGELPGPALSMAGCGVSHEAVAGFLEALKDIDGVTRVGISGSALGETSAAGAPESSEESGGDCQTRDFIARFEIVAAFDEVAVPAVPGAAAAPAVPPTTEAEGTNSAGEQTQDAQNAANIVPGVAR